MSTNNSPTPEKGENDPSWRTHVLQAQRNAQVREIASVLASLEPGATSASKLRLAMQFEDSVFKAASSYSDYQKKLTKRLKKVQKSYTPAQPDHVATRTQQLQALATQHGDTLKYVLQHAHAAYEAMKAKHGIEKASQLQQHLGGAKLWAADLGIVVKADQTVTSGNSLNTTISEEQLTKLQSHLERRLDNIRSHVVKLADPNTFLLETLAKTEQEFGGKPAKILALDARQRYEQLASKQQQQQQQQQIPTSSSTLDSSKLLHEAWHAMHQTVPLANRNDAAQSYRAALLHLDKMRAAGTTVLAYLTVLPDKATLPKPHQQALTKSHAMVTHGLDVVLPTMQRYRATHHEPQLALADAWRKTIVLPTPVVAAATSSSTSSKVTDDKPPDAKRPRMTLLSSSSPRRRRLALSTRVLLQAGRKTPSNLLPALRRKGAVLVRPPPTGAGTHLLLNFQDVFEMTIYLAPLTVLVRASNNKTTPETDASSSSASATLPAWQSSQRLPPLAQGLTDTTLSCWGATANDYDSLGAVVQARLQDASAHATHGLRQHFAHTVQSGGSDFEVEILEATALLEFLTLARTTYLPQWQDVDV